MFKWLPIETLPEGDGLFIITDGKIWGPAKRYTYVQPDEIGYDGTYGGKVSNAKDTRRPNWKAGQREEYFTASHAWLAWDEDTETHDGDFPALMPAASAIGWYPVPERPTY